MNVVIIEDELFAARRLEKMISDVDANLHVVAKLESVKESVAWFLSNPEPDIIFLDIHLDDDLSFSIFKSVKITCPIVFTTATDEIATRAFELMGIDFLLKPIVQAELAAVVAKYSNPANYERKLVEPDLFDDIINEK